MRERFAANAAARVQAAGRSVRTQQFNALTQDRTPARETAAEQPAGEERPQTVREALQPNKPDARDDAPQGDETNADPTQTQFEIARAALLRTGTWTDDEIRSMDRRQAIRRGMKAKREQDRRARERAELEELRSKKGQSLPTHASGAPQSGVPAPSAADRLTELFKKHDIEADPAVKADFEKELTTLLEENAQLKGELDQKNRAQGSEVHQLIESVRAEISKTVTELGDDDDWQDVRDAMVVMSDLPRYANAATDRKVMTELVRAAIREALPEVAERQPADDESQRGASAGELDLSQSSPRAAPKNEKPTPEQAKQAVLNQFKANRSGGLRQLRTG